MLLAFFTRRLRLWLLLALGAPVLAWVLGFVGDRLEARSGPTRLTRGLGKARGWLDRRTRGPLAHGADGHGDDEHGDDEHGAGRH